MADTDHSPLPPPSPEQRRAAVGQFERAQQVSAKGDYDYAIQLLLTCCRLDPANLIYRRLLRQVEKTKYKNNMRGSWLAWLTTSAARARIKSAKRSRDYLKVLEHGEEVLTRNPWDTGAQMDMAEAADALGVIDVAVWVLEQARQKNPKDVAVNRSLARLYEKRGNFTQAIQLWEMVRTADPSDIEARHKAKDLAASDTIARTQHHQAMGNTPTPHSAPAAEKEEEEPAAESAPPPPAQEKRRTRTVPASATPTADRVAREAETLRARIDANPTNPNAYLHLATMYRRADQFEQARAALAEGLGPTANHFDLIIAIADIDIEVFRRNLSVTESKLRDQPQDEELLQLRDQMTREINTRELELYRQKSDRYPADKTHRFELGVRLLRVGQIDEAIRELQALRGEARYQWRALMYLGYCFKNRNNWRLAQRNFEEALQHVPANEVESRKDILFQLAQGLADAGELAQAVEMGHELANLDFSYRDIGRLLDEWQARLQET